MKANKKKTRKEQNSLNPQTRGFGESENIDESSQAQAAGNNDKTQGSLNPQDPTAERLPQGSLNPQDPSADITVQGSLNPYNPAEAAAAQGSLNPQNRQNSDAGGTPQERQNSQNRQNSDAGGTPQESLNSQNSHRAKDAFSAVDQAGAASTAGVKAASASTAGVKAASASTAGAKAASAFSAGDKAAPVSTAAGNETAGALSTSAPSKEAQAGAALSTGDKASTGSSPTAIPSKEAQAGAAPSTGDGASTGSSPTVIPSREGQAGAAPSTGDRASTGSSPTVIPTKEAQAGAASSNEDKVVAGADAGLAAVAASIAGAEAARAAGGLGSTSEDVVIEEAEAGLAATAAAIARAEEQKAAADSVKNGTAASSAAAGAGAAGTPGSGTSGSSGASGAPVTAAPVPAGALPGTPIGTAAGAGGGSGIPGGAGNGMTAGGSAGAGNGMTAGGAAGPGTFTGGTVQEDQKKKSHRGAKAFWITFLLLAMILGGVYYAGYKYSETHFMPGSTLNGYDCSGLTEEEAEKRFADAADKYTLNIHFRGGSTEVLTAQDIGFKYKSDGSIGAMIVGQDQELWPKYFFEDSEYVMDLGGTYDDELLNNALSALPELQKENMKEPENAYIMFREGNETEDGVFEIVPEDPGSTIDLVQLAAGVGDAAARYEQELNAEEVGEAYKEPAIKSDNTDLVSRCKDLNEIVCASITYVLPDKSELKLNSDVMKDWLVKDEKGRLVKDEEVWDEQLWKFMELLAYNSNTIGTDREFESTERGIITVTGGDYGYMVNQIAEHDLLLEDLPAGKKETRKPSYYISPYNEETENDGIGKTYIEVDLTAQHMWCYVDGKMVMQSDCVTGDPTTDHETPTGVFGIMFMKKDTTLRGIQQQNGKYEYETKVSFWMPFYSDCGFHDAWWRTAFGGEIYKGDGSHGCVNLPTEAAEELFSYCDDKMPVVVYK